jgi:hypothetical protein
MSDRPPKQDPFALNHAATGELRFSHAQICGVEARTDSRRFDDASEKGDIRCGAGRKFSTQSVGVFLLELFDQIVPHQKVIEPVSH